MALFESFNKPAWESDDPAVRRTAVDQLEDLSILARLVREDPDDGVRSRALGRISDGGLLDEFADHLGGELQQQARSQRLAQLLPEPDQLERISDDTVLLRIAGLSEDSELVERVIALIGDDEALMGIAVSHPAARVRLNAARGIDDPERLAELLHQTRHKDKSVYRHCKEVLDRQHAVEREAAERKQQLEKLAAAAAQLAGGVDSPEYKARYQTLQARWQTLREAATDEEAGIIEKDLSVCAGRIAELERQQAESARQKTLTAEAGQTFESIIAELENLALPEGLTTAADGPAEFFRLLDGIEDRWLAAMHQAEPSAEQTEACKDHLHHWRDAAQAAQRLLDRQQQLGKLAEEVTAVDKSDFLALQKLERRTEKLLGTLLWPESLADFKPEPIRDLEQQRDALAEKRADLKQKEAKNLEQLAAAFEEFKQELGTNHFTNADRALNRLRNILRRLDSDRQRHYQQELKPLLARLKEIHDWQGFAIEPKKLELIEQMKGLIGSEEDANVLATKIKALQEEWKGLGHIAPRKDQALWKKFSAAADKAYEPCKQAFALQAAQRKDNYRQRMAVVEQLIDYEQRIAWPDADNPDPDAPHPDWRMVQKTLDTARAAFRELKPVDRKGERKSRKALKTVCDRIYGHIRLEYDRNIALKEELVRQARELVDEADLRTATDGAKRVQSEWKQVGITPRQIDRRLWKDLRQACDAIFGRLDERREERQAAAREKAEQAAERKRKKLERWPRLLDRMRACALRSADEPKATELWEQEGRLPRGIDEDALQSYWADGPDDKVAEERLREACIALEVLAGLESPPEDKDARMAYQMQRLVEGMGGLHTNVGEQLLEQINAFIALRPPAAWLERFSRGVTAIRSG